jgi:hypothetical protein
VQRAAAMAALHVGRLAQALELAPCADRCARDALAPYATAVVRAHTRSPTPLSEPPAALGTLAELAHALLPENSAGRGGAGDADAVPARSADAWRCTVAYSQLCVAYAALRDLAGSTAATRERPLMPRGEADPGARLRGAHLSPSCVLLRPAQLRCALLAELYAHEGPSAELDPAALYAQTSAGLPSARVVQEPCALRQLCSFASAPWNTYCPRYSSSGRCWRLTRGCSPQTSWSSSSSCCSTRALMGAARPGWSLRTRQHCDKICRQQPF